MPIKFFYCYGPRTNTVCDNNLSIFFIFLEKSCLENGILTSILLWFYPSNSPEGESLFVSFFGCFPYSHTFNLTKLDEWLLNE